MHIHISRLTSILIITILYCLQAFSQDQLLKPDFKVVNLPDFNYRFKAPAQIQHLTQDSKGFIWITTSVGLYRWDGEHFKIFRHDPENPHSLPGNSNYCRDIITDKLGNVWFTMTEGLCRLNPETEIFTFFPVDTVKSGGLKSTPFYLVEDGQGNIWTSCSDGFSRLDIQNQEFVSYSYDPDKAEGPSSDQVPKYFVDHQQNLWLGMQKSSETGRGKSGLNLYNYENDSFT